MIVFIRTDYLNVFQFVSNKKRKTFVAVKLVMLDQTQTSTKPFHVEGSQTRSSLLCPDELEVRLCIVVDRRSRLHDDLVGLEFSEPNGENST